MILSACSGNSHEQPKLDEESSTATETTNETSEDTYPFVIEAVYLATEELIDREVVILIEATNISDDEIAVGTTTFSYRNKDVTIEFTRVLHGEEEIILKPNETNFLFHYQSSPDDLDIESIDLDDFQVTYTGIHYNNHEPMPIDRMMPENYQAKVDQDISDLKERIAMIEAERMEDSTVENEDPIRINGYQAATNGSIYIRVENLTDEELYFDANYLITFDYAYEYEVDTSQRDSGFDPTVTIPPQENLSTNNYIYYQTVTIQIKMKSLNRCTGFIIKRNGRWL